jgi:hypothetical protein
MKKKIVFGLAMLVALTASLSAQTASVKNFVHVGNVSEQMFRQNAEKIRREFPEFNLRPVGKLPNDVIQAININVSNYSLDTGDVFYAWINNQGNKYVIYLRITDAKNSNWVFFAWLF